MLVNFLDEIAPYILFALAVTLPIVYIVMFRRPNGIHSDDAIDVEDITLVSPMDKFRGYSYGADDD